LHAACVTRGASAIRDASLTELRKFFNQGQAAELTLAICAANFTNRFNDALRALPDLGA
jgi:alkylhydroperoxidase family enzyme